LTLKAVCGILIKDIYVYKGKWAYHILKYHEREGKSLNIYGKLKNKLYKNEDPQQVKKELFWLFKKICQYKKMIFIVGLLGMITTVMSLISSIATKFLIDAVTGFGSEITLAAVLMVSMMLGGLLLQAVSSRVGASVHIKVRNEIQHKTFGKILRATWEMLEPYRSGDILQRLNSDVNIVTDGVISFLPGFITSFVRFLGAFVIMLYYDPIMALIALIGAPVTLLLSKILMSKLREHNLNMKKLTGDVMSFQEDSYRNLTSIKAFSATERYENEMQKLQDEYKGAYLSFNSFQISMSSLLSMVSMAVTVACFGWGAYQLWNGKITYGSMTMFLQLASTLRSSFSQLVSLMQQVISVTTSAGRVIAVEELPSEDTDIPEGFKEEKSCSILLKDVNFRYKNGETVLNNFDFYANPGDQIAITGPSGEGKTTLLRIILGLVEPCEGEASFIGESGNKYKITAGTRYALSYVPQGNSIFAGTVEENLSIIAPDATESELINALKISCAWDFVDKFPKKLKHNLGAGGRGISEGQAQRIAIARAILKKAPILLLDEATSGLDGETEKQLLDNLRNCGLINTCILVTHRTNSAEFCNRAYEIRQGSVKEVEYGI